MVLTGISCGYKGMWLQIYEEFPEKVVEHLKWTIQYGTSVLCSNSTTQSGGYKVFFP